MLHVLWFKFFSQLLHFFFIFLTHSCYCWLSDPLKCCWCKRWTHHRLDSWFSGNSHRHPQIFLLFPQLFIIKTLFKYDLSGTFQLNPKFIKLIKGVLQLIPKVLFVAFANLDLSAQISNQSFLLFNLISHSGFTCLHFSVVCEVAGETVVCLC